MDIEEVIKKIDINSLKESFRKISQTVNLNLSKKVAAAIVIDISSKLALLNIELKPEIKVTALKISELPPDKTSEFIVNSLNSFIQENKIKHNYAILKAPQELLFIKRIQLPAVPENELTEAIKWQIKEDLPFELNQAVWAYTVVKKQIKADGAKTLEIMCVLAKEEEIKNKVLLLKQAGLKCLSVGVLPFFYIKLIERCSQAQRSSQQGILHLEDNLCYLAVYKDKKLEFYRELPISILKLKQALSGTLVSDRGKFELSAKEADNLLFSAGIPDSEAVDKVSANQILALLRPVLERLAQEIKRSLDYYLAELAGHRLNMDSRARRPDSQY